MYAPCVSTGLIDIDCLQCEFPLTIDTEAVQSPPRIVEEGSHFSYCINFIFLEPGGKEGETDYEVLFSLWYTARR